jgi:sirohydrochlorin ferrochelatase
MKTLIILAHGSRREESNQEIRELAKKVKALAGSNYDLLDYAYLEVVAPSLPEAIDSCIDKGASNITVFPYFLNSGNHVKRDIPEMVEAAKEKYPGCSFKISACIGMIDEMPDLILRQALSL